MKVVMKVGDLVFWIGMYDVMGILVGFYHDYHDNKYAWVLLTDGRKELFDPTQLEVISCK